MDGSQLETTRDQESMSTEQQPDRGNVKAPPAIRWDSRLRFHYVIWRWLVPSVAVMALALVATAILSGMRNSVWAYYTDDVSITERALDANARLILWEDPYPAFGSFNRPADVADPAFGPDDATLVFSSGAFSATNSDLFVTEWNGRIWTNERPLVAVNSPSNETGACFSPDGRYLYFASDREGGLGGFDLWLARWDGTNWVDATNAGPSINSTSDDIAPCVSPDGARLYFSSSRPRGTDTDFDIYTARIAVSNDAEALPCMPAFDSVARVKAVCSSADDVDPQVSGRGDFLYFASSRRGGHGGFDLYRARLRGHEVLRPENPGMELNTSANERAPALRMSGFDLAFVSDRANGQDAVPMVYASTAREVIGQMDYSRIDRLMGLLDRLKWWILTAIAMALALLYLARHYRDLTSLFHKCLALSAIVHAIILLLTALWIISSQIIDSMPASPIAEVTIDSNALAKEKLALDMKDRVTELPPTVETILVQQSKDPVSMPEFTPTKAVENALPAVTRSVDESLVTRVTPSAAVRPTETAFSKVAEKLPELARPPVEVVMETRPPDELPVEEKAVLDPTVVQQALPTEFVQLRKPAVRPLASQVAAADIATTNTAATPRPTRDTGGRIGVVSAGVEAKGSLPELRGSGDLIGPMFASKGTGVDLRLDLPGTLDVPEKSTDALAPKVLRYPGKLTTDVITALGGSDETQAAIGRSLDWFTRHQEPDGRWDIAKHGGAAKHDVGATSLALLCYYGWGVRHTEAGPYQAPVKKALAWLLAQVKENGDARGAAADSKGMYDQGMAALALCEAYSMTRDPAILKAASNAVDFICAAQNAGSGGWRYTPGQDADLSVSSWQYMALKSAQLAGIVSPTNVLIRADRYVDSISGGQHGGISGYQRSETSRPAMIASGMFLRQLRLASPREPRMREAAMFMQMNPLNEKDLDYYYLYYGILALYQHRGVTWEEWNEKMKGILIPRQVRTGPDSGAYEPSGQRKAEMGKAVSTAFATLSLEVYYRLLPIYGFSPAEQ